jgi:hypothetical protein
MVIGGLVALLTILWPPLTLCFTLALLFSKKVRDRWTFKTWELWTGFLLSWITIAALASLYVLGPLPWGLVWLALVPYMLGGLFVAYHLVGICGFFGRISGG